MLLNLVTNALRHTPSDGAVAVVVEPDGATVQVSVEDTGEGLEPGARAAGCSTASGAATARARATGAGLGLAIARGLVEAHGGTIWAERRHEGGARVSFTLPSA